MGFHATIILPLALQLLVLPKHYLHQIHIYDTKFHFIKCIRFHEMQELGKLHEQTKIQSFW